MEESQQQQQQQNQNQKRERVAEPYQGDWKRKQT